MAGVTVKKRYMYTTTPLLGDRSVHKAFTLRRQNDGHRSCVFIINEQFRCVIGIYFKKIPGKERTE